jgi:hypothetical protein
MSTSRTAVLAFPTVRPDQASSYIRDEIAQLALILHTNVHVITRSAAVDPEAREDVISCARAAQQQIATYQSLARSLGLTNLVVNTKFLQAAACQVATHLLRGEYEQAQLLQSEVLAVESELSFTQMRSTEARPAAARRRHESPAQTPAEVRAA